jgi:hypothetical protein
MSTKNGKFKVTGFRIGGEDPSQTNAKPDTKPDKRYSLEVKSKKRSNSGFYIFSEYEVAIEKIALISMHRNKGQTLEFLVNFYLSRIPEERLQEILRLMDGTCETDQEDW